MSASPSFERPQWLTQELYPFQNRTIEILGHRIHYVDEGTGPTLLLLHGNGSWSYGFRYAIPILSQHFRCIAPDWPGMGLSVPEKDFSFKPRDHSAVLEAFVAAMGLEYIRLFVEDWGGPIGLGFATRQPSLIHSLIISNTWAWPAQGSPNLEKFSRLAGSWFGHFMIVHFNVLARYATPNVAIGRKMTPDEAKGYWAPYPTAASRTAQATFPYEILASKDYLAEVEAGLDVLKDKPVQIIWGEQDAGFGEAERLRFEGMFNNVQTLTLPDAKHFVLLDQPEKSAGQIIDFEDCHD